MYRLAVTSQFKKDFKKAKKRGKDLSKLIEAVDTLAAGERLDPTYHDHALKGEWEGFRDCHIEGDWLLIYTIDEEAGELLLVRTGTHADLFE